MIQLEFDQWFEEIQESAKNDFEYSSEEIKNFSKSKLADYYDQGLTPFEAIIQYLK